MNFRYKLWFALATIAFITMIAEPAGAQVPQLEVVGWVIQLLGREAAVEEAAAVRGAVATGEEAAALSAGRAAVGQAERRAVNEAGREARRPKPDYSWTEGGPGKKVIKQILKQLGKDVRSGNEPPDGSAIAFSDCLVVDFQGRQNIIQNICDYPIEIGSGWLQVNNKSEVYEYMAWVMTRAGVFGGNWREGDGVDDVFSYGCQRDCIIAAGRSKLLEPAMLVAPISVAAPSGTITVNSSMLDGRTLEVYGPIVAFQYRRI